MKKCEPFKIVGTISNQQEANELDFITKHAVVGFRMGDIAKEDRKNHKLFSKVHRLFKKSK